MSPQKKSSRALRVVVLGVLLEEGTRLARKYGPALLDKMTEQAIDKGPPLVAKGWERVKIEGPPVARKVKDGAVAAGKRAAREAKSLRRTKKGDQEDTEVASPRVPEDGSHEGQEPVQG
jgi:hypothetical protein